MICQNEAGDVCICIFIKMLFQPGKVSGGEEEDEVKCDVICQNEAGDMDPTDIRDITVNTFHRILNNC